MLTLIVNKFYILIVLINYKNRKLEKQLTIPKEMVKAFGQLAKKVKQRHEELKAAENLTTMKQIPAARCHELVGDRKGELAVDVSGNYRMIFEPDHNPIPKKDDGGLNWDDVTKIQINEVEDYH